MCYNNMYYKHSLPDAANMQSQHVRSSEGGRIQLETLIELKLFNSSCSSLSSY